MSTLEKDWEIVRKDKTGLLTNFRTIRDIIEHILSPKKVVRNNI